MFRAYMLDWKITMPRHWYIYDAAPLHASNNYPVGLWIIIKEEG